MGLIRKKRSEDIKDVRKIGVYIGVPGLGDLLFIIPLFRELKRLYPEAKTVFIGKLLRDYVRPVFDACPYIDELMEFHLYESLDAGSLLGFMKRLRAERFDLIVDTQRKLLPTMLLAFGGGRYFVSYSTKSMFSDFPVPVQDRDKRHTADVSLDLARALGAEDIELNLELTTTQESRKKARDFLSRKNLSGKKPIVGIIPSAGHPSRCWTGSNFAQLCDRLVDERGCGIICFGTEYDKPVTDEIIALAKAPIVMEEQGSGSILDSAALMSLCRVIVGVDSGPLHVADAAGAPCVGIYGPTLPDRFGLLGDKNRALCHYLDCTPCSNHECGDRKCIEGITVQEVFNAVCEFL